MVRSHLLSCFFPPDDDDVVNDESEADGADCEADGNGDGDDDDAFHCHLLMASLSSPRSSQNLFS